MKKSEEYFRILRLFNKKIDNFNKKYPKRTDNPHVVERDLFVATYDLTIKDWKIIRNGDYYLIRDTYKGIKQKKFILERVIQYKERIIKE